ncbi:MAG: hypothetical protein H6Q14_1424 [Bacteroidetes bacterium]|nr:hypothetical protein [Bacteroidota bacterium]
MVILHRIRAYLYDNLLTNNSSELLVVIPALPAGEYVVEVVTQYTTGVLLKEPRSHKA